MINISNITQKAVSVEGLEVVRDDLIEMINSKVGIESGKGLSTNDLTDTLKTNYDAAYEHSQTSHAPSNAQANVIEKILVNNTEQITNNKTVNISVPTSLASLSADSTHRLVTDSEKTTWNNKQDSLVADSDYLTPSTASNTYQPKGNYATDEMEILLHPNDATVTLHETISFYCSAINAVSYQWQYFPKNGTSWSNSGATGSTTTTLSLEATEARNGQKYKCIVTDKDGNTLTSNTATLTVYQTRLADTIQAEGYRTVTDAEKNTWNSKQNELTAGSNINIDDNTISAMADSTPTKGSTNLVTSGGVFDQIESLLNAGSDGVVAYTVENTTNNASKINLPSGVSANSVATVFQDGILLIPNIHYTLSGTQIELLGYTANSGALFTVTVCDLSSIEHANISTDSVLLSSENTQFGNSSTLQSALNYIANDSANNIQNVVFNGESVTVENRTVNITSPIREVKVDGTKLTPDANGAVSFNIPVKSVQLNGQTITPNSNGVVNVNTPIKSVQVNGTNLTPDSNGAVNVSVPIKSVQLNGTTVSPNSSGTVSLSVTPSSIQAANATHTHTASDITGDTLLAKSGGTLTGKLYAQSNADYSTAQVRNVTLSTEEPDDSQGNNGDIWLIYEEE